jgi:hypothetical protein
MSAAVRSSRIMKAVALGGLLSLFAVISLSGCQSAADKADATELAKTNATTTSTPASNWPKTLTIPSGTALIVALDTPLATDANKAGDTFRGRLRDAIHVDQMTVLPAGTEVRGRLTVVEEPHRTTGKAQMTLAFDEIVDPAGKSHDINTSPIVLVAEGDKISDEEKVAAGAVIGGIIGAVTSSQQRAKGAAVGAAAGAAAGGAVAIATKGHQIQLTAGQQFSVDLNESIQVSTTQQTASR